MNFQALRATLFASCLVTAAACGGNDDGPGVDLVDASAIDGNGNGDVDGNNQQACSIPGDLGSPAGLTFSATVSDQEDPKMPGAVFVSLLAVTDQGPPIDAINIQLWPGFGVFDPALVTGSFPIAGVEADFYNCGACALLIGDFDTNTNMNGQDFVASSGTVNITTASTTIGETIEGSIDNVVFRQVTFDDKAQMQTDVPNGCTVNLTSAPFTALLEAPPMARRPAPSARR